MWNLEPPTPALSLLSHCLSPKWGLRMVTESLGSTAWGQGRWRDYLQGTSKFKAHSEAGRKLGGH